MKLDEEFLGEKDIYDILANMPGIRGYFYCNLAFLLFSTAEL